MVKLSILPRSALAPYLKKGRYGSPEGSAGLLISELKEFGLANVTAFKDQGEALQRAIKIQFDVDLPQGPQVVTKAGISFVGIAPGQWWAFAEEYECDRFFTRLEACVGMFGTIVNQSDARAIVELSGPKVRSVLSKGVSVDLDERNFRMGDAATTMAAQLWITIWQTDEEPTYRLSVFRAFGSSLLDWLTTSSAEFGYEII